MYSQEGDLKKINDLIEIDSFILTVGDSISHITKTLLNHLYMEIIN